MKSDRKGTHKTILCVDDEEGILAALRRLFRPTPYRVMTASDGKETLMLARAEPPDLILLDIRMPEMDGYTFLEHLREQGLDEIPVVMLTAEGTSEAILAGYGKGCTYYIEKPFKNEVVLNIVEYLAGEPSDERRAWLEQRL